MTEVVDDGGDDGDVYRRLLNPILSRRFLSGDDGGSDDDCMTTDEYEAAEGDDAYAYRRLSEFFARSRSCDDHSNKEVAWVNVEVWDFSNCCDVKGDEGGGKLNQNSVTSIFPQTPMRTLTSTPCPLLQGMFFFIMMILFWYGLDTTFHKSQPKFL